MIDQHGVHVCAAGQAGRDGVTARNPEPKLAVKMGL